MAGNQLSDSPWFNQHEQWWYNSDMYVYIYIDIVYIKLNIYIYIYKLNKCQNVNHGTQKSTNKMEFLAGKII